MMLIYLELSRGSVMISVLVSETVVAERDVIFKNIQRGSVEWGKNCFRPLKERFPLLLTDYLDKYINIPVYTLVKISIRQNTLKLCQKTVLCGIIVHFENVQMRSCDGDISTSVYSIIFSYVDLSFADRYQSSTTLHCVG